MSTPDPAYLSLAALTVYASVSKRTLRRWIDRAWRPLPAFRVGRALRVRRDEFDAWLLEERRREETPLRERLNTIRGIGRAG